MKSKHSKNSKHSWIFYIILIFLAVRIILNLFPPISSLSIFFIISYTLLAILLLTKSKHFPILFILFLAIDSLIGTHLFTTNNNLGIEYYGTMLINLIFIILGYYYKK